MINKKTKLIIILTIFLIFLIGLLTIKVLFYKQEKKDLLTEPSLTIKPTKTINNKTNEFNPILFKPETLIFDSNQINQELSFQVLVNSNNHLVVGFDLVFKYDPKIVKFLGFKNLVTDQIDLYKVEKDNFIFFTGVKKTNYQRDIIFNQQPVLRLNWQIIQPKSTTIELIADQNKKNDSNLITDQMIDLINQEKKIALVAGKKINLQLNQTKKINSLDLTLSQINLPPKTCRDCFEEIKLKVKSNNQEKIVTFQFGGFAGIMKDQVEVFDYNFFLDNYSTDEVSLFIYEKK